MLVDEILIVESSFDDMRPIKNRAEDLLKQSSTVVICPIPHQLLVVSGIVSPHILGFRIDILERLVRWDEDRNGICKQMHAVIVMS